MADFDSKLPIRSLAADNTTELADSTGTTINPAKEDGNLLSIKTNTDTLAGAISGAKYQENLSQVGGSAITLGQKTMANSIPVVIASDQTTVTTTTTAVTETAPDFKKATAIAANASDTHSFTPGSTISLDKITASASGQLKVEVQWGPTGSETSKWVSFTSKGNLYTELELPNPISIPNTSTIKVIVTNLDNQAMDLYSSIIYH